MLSNLTRIELMKIHEESFEKRGKIEPWSIEDVRFLAFSLCGEAGELANKIKKHWRGDDVTDPFYDEKVHEELADCIAYCSLLAYAFQIDPDRIIRAKIPEIMEKLKHGSPEGHDNAG